MAPTEVIKKHIQRWLQNGTINEQQAQIMLQDVHAQSKEDSSNKLIVTVSTVGSILLGIGAIMFVASNWQSMSSMMKLIILIFGVTGVYYLGYYFQYAKKNLPKVGRSLIFLSTLLFGATIFLIAQMYHINANNHVLILLWLVGVMPFAYALNSVVILSVSIILFLLWVPFFIFQNMEPSMIGESALLMPMVYIAAGTALYSVGGNHYFIDQLKRMARIMRLFGLRIAMLALFIMTFALFSGDVLGSFRHTEQIMNTANTVTVMFTLLLIVTVISGAINLFFNPQRGDTVRLETSLLAAILIPTALLFFNPTDGNTFTLIFNFVFAGIAGVLIYFGYDREDSSLLNTGIGWLSVYILVKYFDFFWELMPRSIFFMVGGIILVLGGISLERKRREVVSKFNSNEAENL